MDTENQEAMQQPPAAPADVAKIIEDLKSQNLSDEQIMAALEKAVQDGKLSAEDLEKAKQILANGGANNDAQEEQEAEKMFGMKFVK